MNFYSYMARPRHDRPKKPVFSKLSTSLVTAAAIRMFDYLFQWHHSPQGLCNLFKAPIIGPRCPTLLKQCSPIAPLQPGKYGIDDNQCTGVACHRRKILKLRFLSASLHVLRLCCLCMSSMKFEKVDTPIN